MLRVLLAVCLVFSPFKTDYRYSYIEKSNFTWNDFKAFPDAESPFAANVNTGISHTYELDNNGKLVPNTSQITAYFYPKLSWYKPDLVSKKLLKHERLHFAISELHARMFQQRVAHFHFTENTQQEIKQLYKEIEQQRQQMQALFDQQTRHGLDTEQEEFWQEKVSRLLAKY